MNSSQAVLSPPTMYPLTTLSVDEGEYIKLMCNVTTMGKPSFSWYWYLDTEQQSSSLVTSFDTLTHLTLKATSRYDQTQCKCGIYYSSRYTFSESETITVYHVPSTFPTLSFASSSTVIQGRYIIMRCSLSSIGNPPVLWSWYCGDEKIENIITNTGTVSELKLKAESKYDSQYCYCRAHSSRVSLKYDRHSATRDIGVYYVPPTPPELTALSPIKVNEGTQIKLRCNISQPGNPRISWSWQCGSSSIHNHISNYESRSELTFTTKSTHNNVYCYCRARSSSSYDAYDVTSNRINITVYYVPNAAPSLQAVTSTSSDEGSAITLRCTVSSPGNPPIVWQWYCGDEIINNTILYSETSSDLKLISSSRYNGKECYCRAITTSQSLSYNHSSDGKTLKIYYAPSSSPSLFANNTEIFEGNEVSLKCNLTTLGNPPITWSWYCGTKSMSRSISNFGTQSVLTFIAGSSFHKVSCYCRAQTTRSSFSYDVESIREEISVFYVPNSAPSLKAISSTSMDEGSIITLRCTVSSPGNPPIIWQWYCGGEIINNTILYSETSSDLKLISSSRYNGKECYCRAITTSQSLSYNQSSDGKTLKIYYAPSSSPNLFANNTVIREGNEVSLKCNLTTLGNPPITWSWYCGTKSMSRSISSLGTQSVLTFIAESSYHKVSCYCRAQTTRSSFSYDVESNREEISVLYVPNAAPSLTTSSTSMNEGSIITLRCTISSPGNPPIVWQWYCGDEIINNTILYSETSTDLQLVSSLRYNGKKCYCRAITTSLSLSYNHSSNGKTLTIYYAPSTSPSLFANNTEIFEGNQISLKCNLTTLGNPPITWLWYCGTKSMTRSISNFGTQSVLTFIAESSYHKVSCYCRTRSTRSSLSYDERSNRKDINVFYVPSSFPRLTPSKLPVVEGTTFTLTCTLNMLGNPAVIWTWTCNNQSLNAGVSNAGTTSEVSLAADIKYNRAICFCKAKTPSEHLTYEKLSNKIVITFTDSLEGDNIAPESSGTISLNVFGAAVGTLSILLLVSLLMVIVLILKILRRGICLKEGEKKDSSSSAEQDFENSAFEHNYDVIQQPKHQQ